MALLRRVQPRTARQGLHLKLTSHTLQGSASWVCWDRPVNRGPNRQPEHLLEEQGRWGREKQCLGCL